MAQCNRQLANDYDDDDGDDGDDDGDDEKLETYGCEKFHYYS